MYIQRTNAYWCNDPLIYPILCYGYRSHCLSFSAFLHSRGQLVKSMTTEIPEIREAAHKLLDDFFDEKLSASQPDTIVVLKPEKLAGRDVTTFSAFELQAAIDAKYVKLSVDATKQQQIEDELRGMIVAGRIKGAGIRGTRPESEKDTFHNADVETFEEASELIAGKLKGANPSQYRFISYDADKGKLKVAVQSSDDHMWH